MNKFIIEQTKEATLLAISLHQNAEMGGVRLARAKAVADNPESALKDLITVSMEVKAKQIDGTTNHLLIEVFFRLTGSRKADRAKTKIAVCVECTFEVRYQLRPGFTPSPEQIKAFKDGNAIFNCWPYCRQHVQDMLLRMGYPALTLPFLRVVTKQRESRKSLKPE